MKKRPLYVYTRVSSEKQLTGDGLNRQSKILETVQDYESRYNAEFKALISDAGVSAFSGANSVTGNLGQFIKDCEVGLINNPILVLESIDRLTRMEVDDSRDLINRMFKAGIDLIVQKMSGELLTKKSKSSFSNDLTISIFLHLANMESEQKSKRIKETFKNNLTNKKIKCSNHLPFWIDYRDGEYILNNYVDNLRLIFELRKQGYSVLSIARHLNDNGIKLGAKQRANVSANRIKHLLLRGQAIGQFLRYDSSRTKIIQCIDDYFPPAIELNDFKIVAESFKDSRTRETPSISNVFYGLTYCTCGSTMTAYHSQRDDYYLRCKNKTQGVTTQSKKCFNGAIKYKSIIEPCLKLFFNHVSIETILNNNQDTVNIDSLKSSLDDEKKRLSKLKKMFMVLEDDESLLTDLAECKATIKRIESTINEHEQPLQHDVSEWRTLVDHPLTTKDDKIKVNGILKKFVKSIHLQKDGKIGCNATIVFKSGLTTKLYLPSMKHNEERFNTFSAMVTASNCTLPIFDEP